ncbi:MAG: 6,7-dimethyl-8-ribityllumazine synthase [Oceanicaulis sp.]|nr:6,7-dimethyl-8-ribityllumazine synthase [Oceanicaulis sp.]MAZ91220.1 6,7-dimethyl-8-ribityllumazine synthase [Maricaulis sp.]MBI74286.1 6,7-dimethyl-8-ribityllumazine synthase [Oceanicaulis sp.]|tara:strand:+ start:56 stop:487 length:432 start_codon:yes stop_codon:yes gene_type:complete
MSAPKLLIVAGTFYRDIADALIKGAKGAAEVAGATAELVEVPGALEIPGAIVQAEIAEADFDGYVALGCVIRGETTHYDYVCTESARGLMELNLNGVIAGNGILTVENRTQALKRAVDKNKGADAANAALALIALRDRFGSAK